MNNITKDDLVPGLKIKYLAPTNTISRITVMTEVEVLWVENNNIHYRVSKYLNTSQTSIERFLDIVNYQPRN